MQSTSAAIRQRRKNGTAAEPSVRRRLLDSAARLFAENEYSAVRVSDVAAAAGTTTTMITYHFGNRQTLYERAADSALSRLIVRFEKARSLRPGARVDGMIKTLVAGLGDEMDAARLLQRELLRPPQSRTAATQRCVTRLLELILGTVSAARRAGDLGQEVNPALFAQALLSMVLQTTTLWPAAAPILGTRLDGEDLEQLAGIAVELASRGFGTANPRQFDLFAS